MDEKTRETLSFLARMILRQENNNGIPVPDVDRLKRIGDGTASKNEQEEPIIDFDKNTYVKVKVRGQVFDCYLNRLDQDLISHDTVRPTYATHLHLTAVNPRPLMMAKPKIT